MPVLQLRDPPARIYPTVITRDQRLAIRSEKVSISRNISRKLNSSAAARHSSMMIASAKIDNVSFVTARCVPTVVYYCTCW